jgi:hypothetical protein
MQHALSPQQHCASVKQVPPLDAGSTAQNVCNLAWALSTMRFQPSPKFSQMLQTVLLKFLNKAPHTIHPQNIGDMLQSIAVLRLHVHKDLLAACDAWMRLHVGFLLPNHILAYLNVRISLSSVLPKLAAKEYNACAGLHLTLSKQLLDADIGRYSYVAECM